MVSLLALHVAGKMSRQCSRGGSLHSSSSSLADR